MYNTAFSEKLALSKNYNSTLHYTVYVFVMCFFFAQMLGRKENSAYICSGSRKLYTFNYVFAEVLNSKLPDFSIGRTYSLIEQWK